jgi:regulatory protein
MRSAKPRLLDGSELLNYALKSLSARGQSERELRTRLVKRASDPGEVEDVMRKLKDAGYLDDARFAESYAAARRDNQGFGQMRVMRDLRSRQISGQVAEGAVRGAFEGKDEEEMIEQFLERKYRSVNLPQYLNEEKHLASTSRKLRLAGFDSTKVIRVLKRYAARADELADEEPSTEE